jgi:hypothetical protein
MPQLCQADVFGFASSIHVFSRQRLRRDARRSLQYDTASKCLEFRDHDTNTQAPPNEQAGTAVSEQPFAARPIDSMLNQQGNF